MAANGAQSQYREFPDAEFRSGHGIDPARESKQKPAMFNKGTTRRPDGSKPRPCRTTSRRPGTSWLSSKWKARSGAGLVKVVMTCKHDVKRITIDPSLLAEDKDMLEDLVAAAFNAAVRKAEETSAEKMGKLTAGMPGLPAA